MTITMGQLVCEVFDAYERRYHDKELAAIATQVTLADILSRASRKRRARAERRRGVR